MKAFQPNFVTSAVSLAVALLAGGAYASDGTISITGKITDASCSINIDGSTTGDATVELPVVSASSLQAPTDTAGLTQFRMELSGCTASTGTLSSVRAYFEPTNVNAATGNLVNLDSSATGAKNVEIQIVNDQGGAIDLRDNSNNLPTPVDPDTSTATLVYAAQYIGTANGAAVAGDVNTDLMYSLEYN